jgi:hypothetical protein
MSFLNNLYITVYTFITEDLYYFFNPKAKVIDDLIDTFYDI